MGDIRLIDISDKKKTHRKAVAKGTIQMKQETLELCEKQALPKGDIFSCAKVAAYLAAKRTADLLPLCHPIELTNIEINFNTKYLPDERGVIEAKVKVEGFERTGFEMEALTSTSVALLTIYDMCKSVDQTLVISDIELIQKSGGKSDFKKENDFTG